MTRLGRSLIVVAALGPSLLGSGCAANWVDQTPDEVVLAGEEVVLPVRWYSVLPVVEVFLDGEGPYSFLIDTGTSFAFVSPRIAAVHCEGTFPLDEPLPISGPGGETMMVSEAVPVMSLRMGSAELRMFAAMVLDLDFLSDSFGFRVDGILGFSAFSTGLLTLDYPRKEVRFARGELPALDGSTVLPLYDQGAPCVDLDWKGKPLRVTLDSGSNRGIELGEWPGGAEFLSPLAETERGGISISGILERTGSARVRGAMGLGRLRLLDPVLSLTRGTPRIGTDVFGRFSITLDPVHGKLRILGDPVEWRDSPIRSSGASVQPYKGTFTIIDVLPGSPAEKAGVRIGDLVLVWDGIPADAEHQVELVFGDHSNGTTERMTLRRDGRDIEVEIPIVDLVP